MQNITFDKEKLTPEQLAVVESILKMAEAEVSSKPEQKYCIRKPTKGDHYFYYDSAGIVWEGQWDYNWIDNERYDHGNYYRTKEEATFAVERNKVVTELRRFAAEYSDTIDWSDPSSKKYMLYLDYSDNRVYYYNFDIAQFNDPVFSSEEIARAAIKTIGEDRLIKYYFGSYKEQE